MTVVFTLENLDKSKINTNISVELLENAGIDENDIQHPYNSFRKEKKSMNNLENIFKFQNIKSLNQISHYAPPHKLRQ
mgnify:CR=1 FL=1